MKLFSLSSFATVLALGCLSLIHAGMYDSHRSIFLLYFFNSQELSIGLPPSPLKFPFGKSMGCESWFEPNLTMGLDSIMT
jgi:hypothetical protein